MLFLAFQCDTFGFDSYGEPATKSYLIASLDVECWSGAHTPTIVIAAVFIVLWPVALPVLYALLLFRCRNPILSHQPSRLSHAIRFLWSEYNNANYWYEMVALAQRLVLTNFVILINVDSGGSDKLLRLITGLLVALVGLMVQLVLKPFRRRSDDVLAAVIQLMLILVFM